MKSAKPRPGKSGHAKTTSLLLAPIALAATLAMPAHSSQLGEADLAMLPEYCQARFAGPNSMAYKSWNQRLGESNFRHIHHFCYGLAAMNRSRLEFDSQKKTAALRRAIREFDYVLKRWPKEFSLYPQAMVYQQHAETMLIMVP